LAAVFQTVEGLEFTILLGRVFAWILDELGHQRKGPTVARDELGFQDGMVVERLSAPRASQAVRAVPLGEYQHAGVVNHHEKVATEQAIGIQHLSANQRLGQAGDDFLHLGGVESAERGVERVAVGTTLRLKNA
jgi:hypothetical protein